MADTDRGTSASRFDWSKIWRKSDGSDDSSSWGLLEFLILSALMLYWEICLIRWVSAEVRLFAYYKNLSLLAAFLGFGVGLLTVHRQKNWLRSCVLWLTVMVTLIVVYPHSPFRIDQAPAFFEEYIWSVQITGIGVISKFYGVLLGVFALNALAFVAFGRRIGYYFELMKPIPAYSLNITANIAGIAIFSLLSAAEVPPVAWVAIGFLPLLLIGFRTGQHKKELVALVGLALVLTGFQFQKDKGHTFWSPYYRISVEAPSDDPYGKPFATLRVNHDYHQRLLDLRPESVETHSSFLEEWANSYNLPYEFGPVDRVLVVGAGTGNDVAAALRHGASHVTAVEIDKTILRLGKDQHPENPYDDPRVETIVTDARAFLSHPPEDKPFDLIVFGLLDSHTQISGMTSLRLDNFVYTQESFALARQLLDPESGLLSVSFSSGTGKSPWTLRRLYRMLNDTFGVSPEVAFTGYDAGVSMFAGPALEGNSFLASKTFSDLRVAARERLSNEEALRETPASDDWPFLYLRRQAMPLEYWFIIALITGISALWIVTAVGREGLKRFSWHFFFLGAAFLLIEVKNLVSFSLIFGSTWQVNNLAIGGILVMILLANLLAAKKTDLEPYVPYGLLAIVLILGLFITAEDFVGLSPTMQALVVPLYLSLPIFCAGLVFIRSFSLAAFPAAALGANIIGGICGGLMENASLAWGFSALQVAAIVLYGLSFASMRLESRQ